MEHSLSFSHRALPCLSASTCNKHTERPDYLWWTRVDFWFTVNDHNDSILISSVIIETIYPNHTLQKNITFTWQTSGSGILQRIPLAVFVCMWVVPVSLCVWDCLCTSQWAACRLRNWTPLPGMRTGNLPCNSEHTHKVAAVIKGSIYKDQSYSIVIAKRKSRSLKTTVVSRSRLWISRLGSWSRWFTRLSTTSCATLENTRLSKYHRYDLR